MQVWKNKPYSFSSDVWALGCVLFEMCTFTVPFEARSMSELRYKVSRNTDLLKPLTMGSKKRAGCNQGWHT